jgi:short-subunit dehydrogenase
MNNAGIGIYGNFEKMGIADYELALGINVLGVIRGVLAFLPHLLKKGSGYIINTASRAGFNGDCWPYPLSKHAIIGYSEGLYCHLRPKGIMVSVLCPALVNTNLPANSPIVGNEQEINEMKQRQKIMFAGPDSLDPDDVARIVIEAMREKRFLILTPKTEDMLAAAMNRGRDYQKLERYLQDTYQG